MPERAGLGLVDILGLGRGILRRGLLRRALRLQLGAQGGRAQLLARLPLRRHRLVDAARRRGLGCGRTGLVRLSGKIVGRVQARLEALLPEHPCPLRINLRQQIVVDLHAVAVGNLPVGCLGGGLAASIASTRSTMRTSASSMVLKTPAVASSPRRLSAT